MNTEKKFWDEFWKTREGLNMENLEVTTFPRRNLTMAAPEIRVCPIQRRM